MVTEQRERNLACAGESGNAPSAAGEPKSLDQAPRATQALLDSLYATAPLGLAFLDNELRYRRVNQRLAERNGLPIAAHLGRTPAEILLDKADLGRVMAACRTVLATGEPQSNPAAEAKNHHRLWNESFFPVPLDGEIVGIGMVVEEITERSRRERTDREASRGKDEFLALLAGELGDPLALIRDALEILQCRAEPGSEPAAAADLIARQVARLGRMAADLQDLSRIGSGEIVLQPERLVMQDICRGAVATVRPLLDAKAHRLESRVPTRSLGIEGDPARLLQVLTNLLDNAAKFTAPGGDIVLTLEGLDNQAVVRVRDNGAGLSAEFLPRVFAPFSHGGRGRDPRQGGLGIGLALVRGLVERHGGRVEAHSEGPARGSEFVVRLPLVGAPLRPRAMVPATAGLAGALRVLVVDDNRDAAESLALMLDLEGHAVRTAEDGYAALGLARSFRPGVVLLDIGLPGIDGYQVARRLREDPETAGVTIIAVSGYGSAEDLRRSAEAGFDLHLIKPVDPDRLNGVLAGMARPLAR